MLATIGEKQLSQVGHLNIHKQGHTGETLYVCNQCKKSFSRSDTSKIHKSAQPQENH